MNIEEEIKILRTYMERSPFNTSLKPQELGLSEAIETLLTAYEKEKEKNKEVGVILGKRIKICNEFQLELEKEKEKNKNARYYIIDRLNNDDIMNIGIDDMKIILDMLEE